MKKYIFLLAILTSLTFFVSCEEDKLDTYSTQDNVYFIHPLDSVTLNLKGMVDGKFSYVEDSIVQIPVRIMGMISDVDRSISARAVVKDDVKNLDSLLMGHSQATYGTDFEVLSSIVPANSEVGYLNVKLKNSNKLKETGDTIVAAIMLIPSDDLITDYGSLAAKEGDKSSLVFRFFYYSNITEGPRLWALGPALRTGVYIYWGDYTPEKFSLIVKACNLNPELFEFTDDEYKTINNITSDAFKVSSGGLGAVFNDRFGSTDVLSGWRRQVVRYLELHPEEWDNFPDGKIEWNTVAMFGGITWGVWTKP